MPTLATETLRRLVLSFPAESDREVKNQVVNAVVRLYQDASEDRKELTTALLKYLLDLCKYDHHYDIRDKARLLNAVFFDENSPLRTLATEKLMEVREDPMPPREFLYLPNTVSSYVISPQVGRKVEGYAKLWEDFSNLDALRPFLMEDTAPLREEEEVTSLVAVLPPQTHYSSEDTPKIGDTGLKQRAPAVNEKSLNAFLESSEEEDSEEGSEESDS